MIPPARSQEPNTIKQYTTVENAIIDTPSHRIDYLSQFTLSFDLHDGLHRIKLALEPNLDILAEDASVQHLDNDGLVAHEERIDRFAHKVFKGTAHLQSSSGRWDPVGWARVYVKQDGPRPLFEGAFKVLRDYHHIELQSTYLQKRRAGDIDIPRRDTEYMIVYRDSDMLRPAHPDRKRSFLDESQLCNADKLGYNSYPNHPFFENTQLQSPAKWGAMSVDSLLGLYKRQSDTGGVSGNTGGVNLASTINSTAGCPNTRKVALIGVATDCGFMSSFSSNQTAREWIINVVNTASSLYESSFNISIGLRQLTTSQPSCPSTAPASAPWNMPCTQGNITQRLDLFSQWRGSLNDNNAYWTLMSTCNTGAEVGLSWLGQLCNTGASRDGADTVSGTNFVVKTSANWQVFAHESGHTFGAVHDCDAQTCAAGYAKTSQCCPLSTTSCDAGAQYIMNPAASGTEETFSPCTIGNICSALGRSSVNSTCLSPNRGVVTINGGQCGNGIVEVGEECDCGGPTNCGDNPCCDAKTCKFKNGAVCDPSNEECCTNCQFASSGTVCRPSAGICDIQEVCPGNSSTCPADQFVADGTKCGTSPGLACASGQCTSRDVQCRSVMGTLLSSNDTYACDSMSCQMQCAAPDGSASQGFGPGTCLIPQQNYLDGTPCGGGGHCRNGQCLGSSVGGEIKSWVDDHKWIVIAVCATVGGLILFSIVSCCVNRCRRNRAGYQNKPPPSPLGAWAGVPVNAPPAEYQMQPYPYPSSPGGGGGGYPPPPYPPPHTLPPQYPPPPGPGPQYGYGHGYGEPNAPQQQYMPLARYA